MKRSPFATRDFQDIAVIYTIAVALNYAWEVIQAPLYAGADTWSSVWWHCLIASLGDGILVLLIFASGWAVFGRFGWYRQLNRPAWSLMIAVGLFLGVTVEWGAVSILNRWSYLATMPLIPGTKIGLVPVLQMLLLPPLIFYAAGNVHHKAYGKD